MYNRQLQLEIQGILENAPDDVLAKVLRFLQEMKAQELANDQLSSQNLDRIFEEDQELLKKLAS